jgi:hypothetical protein
MRTCQEWVTATARCGKPAVISVILGVTADLCAECAGKVYKREREKVEGVLAREWGRRKRIARFEREGGI